MVKKNKSHEDPNLPPILNTESHLKETSFGIAINNGRLEIIQEDSSSLKISTIQIINLLGQVCKNFQRKQYCTFKFVSRNLYCVYKIQRKAFLLKRHLFIKQEGQYPLVSISNQNILTNNKQLNT